MTTPVRPRRPFAIPLGRPFGVELRASLSFLVLGMLVADLEGQVLSAALPGRSGVTIAAVAICIGLGLLLSVALHELAHAAVGRRLGLPVTGIVLYLFGGMTNLDAEPASPGAQAAVTLAGPLVNLLLGGVCAAAAWLSGSHGLAPDAVFQVAVLNTLLAGYNLVPGLPLDGGQLLRAVLWRLTHDRTRALRGAAWGGIGVGAAFGVAGALELHTTSSLALLALTLAAILVVSGMQVLRSSGMTLRLAGVSAGQIARRAFTAEPDLPLSEALRRAELAGASAVLLGTPDRPIAVLVDSLVASVPLARRPWVAASTVARRLLPGMVIDARLSGDALLEALRRTPAGEYVVVDGATVVGVLQLSDLAAVASGRPAAGTR